MQKRPLGNSGLAVSPLALGANVFGWTVPTPQASFPILDAFVDLGFDLIDTADMYSTWVSGNQGGESETIIGQWFAANPGKRGKVVLATKVGMPMGHGGKGLSKDYILRAVEDSLRRLQTDYIDLYQSHKDDPDTPLAETLEAYQTLIEQGKVRHIGASNYTAQRLGEALETGRLNRLPEYISLQPEYNLYDRAGFEAELEPLCLKHGIGVIPYFALAAGFLTGKYRSEADLHKSARGGGVGKKYLNPRGLRILDALDAVAPAHGVNPGVIALAWLMARSSITAPIASATSVAQLQEIAKAADIALTPEQVLLLDTASAY
ncbi:NADP-dependent aryl-alcohol dehydrogenase [Bryobacterales bacterium F-183]|nr:NADP-dependent aryl-alcohol dehydrogenase [Bryobacterales bacterium F-183]